MAETANNVIYVGTTKPEHWKPTLNLRWLKKEAFVSQLTGMPRTKHTKELQQEFVSNKGNYRWDNVPTVET